MLSLREGGLRGEGRGRKGGVYLAMKTSMQMHAAACWSMRYIHCTIYSYRCISGSHSTTRKHTYCSPCLTRLTSQEPVLNITLEIARQQIFCKGSLNCCYHVGKFRTKNKILTSLQHRKQAVIGSIQKRRLYIEGVKISHLHTFTGQRLYGLWSSAETVIHCTV